MPKSGSNMKSKAQKAVVSDAMIKASETTELDLTSGTYKASESKKRIKKIFKALFVVFTAGIAYGVITGWLGFGIPCPFHFFTGLKCPGCGVSRMFISLIKFDFQSAFYANRLLFITFPVILCLIGVNLFRYISVKPMRVSRTENIIYIILTSLFLIFGAVRNVPGVNW